ncbi:MAG: hypothetical protein GY826_36115, partial [Fuerstiella sp.]|nr:hypothetical protein [Fuerstiella sp.]
LWSAATFLLLLLPVLNFFKITTLMNDRYLYLPCITCFALLAACLQRFLTVTTEGRGRVAISIANGAKWMLTLGAVSAAFAVTTSHLPVWKNADSLWNHAMTRAPQLPVVRIQYALTLHDNGHRPEAIRILQQALLQTEPDELDRKRILRAIRSWQKEQGSRAVARSVSVR